MKTILFVSLLVASGAWADEATDLAGIKQTVVRLGGAMHPQPALFTPDFADSAAFERLTSVGSVVISKEPFGEAQIVLPPATGTRFAIQSIRFVTGEVALVDALDGQNGRESVLLVMKKEGADWRLAAFKRIAEQVITAP